MPITDFPQQNESAGQLGKVKVDGTGIYDADTKIKAAQWNQAVLRLIQLFNEVGLSDGSTPDSLNARVATLEGDLDALIDDNDDLSDVTGGGWIAVDSAAGGGWGFVVGGSQITPAFPSSGVHVLTVDGTSGAKWANVKPGAAVVIDPVQPIIAEIRFRRPADGTTLAIADDGRCAVRMGFFGVSGADDQVIIVDDAGPQWKIATIVGGVPATHNLTLPSGSWGTFRLTVSAAGTKVEVSMEDADYVTLLTTTDVPTLCPYVPQLAIDGVGAGDRAVLFDRFRTVGLRAGAQGTAGTVQPFDVPGPFPGFGSDHNHACVGDDSRLSDSRTPTAHAPSHRSNGSDPLLPPARAVSASTDSVAATDVGGAVHYSHASPTVSPVDLSGSIVSGQEAEVDLVFENVAAAPTLHVTGAARIDGYAVDLVLPRGPQTVRLASRDWTDWKTGLPLDADRVVRSTAPKAWLDDRARGFGNTGLQTWFDRANGAAPTITLSSPAGQAPLLDKMFAGTAQPHTDNSAKYMRDAAVTPADVMSTTSWHFFAVVMPTLAPTLNNGIGADHGLFGFYGPGGWLIEMFLNAASDYRIRLAAHDAVGWKTLVTGSTFAVGTPIAIEFAQSGGTLSARVNGVNITGTAIAALDLTAAAGFQIGLNTANAVSGNAAHGMMAFWNAALTGGKLTMVRDYIAQAYGVAT